MNDERKMYFTFFIIIIIIYKQGNLYVVKKLCDVLRRSQAFSIH